MNIIVDIEPHHKEKRNANCIPAFSWDSLAAAYCLSLRFQGSWIQRDAWWGTNLESLCTNKSWNCLWLCREFTFPGWVVFKKFYPSSTKCTSFQFMLGKKEELGKLRERKALEMHQLKCIASECHFLSSTAPGFLVLAPLWFPLACWVHKNCSGTHTWHILSCSLHLSAYFPT